MRQPHARQNAAFPPFRGVEIARGASSAVGGGRAGAGRGGRYRGGRAALRQGVGERLRNNSRSNAWQRRCQRGNGRVEIEAARKGAATAVLHHSGGGIIPAFRRGRQGRGAQNRQRAVCSGPRCGMGLGQRQQDGLGYKQPREERHEKHTCRQPPDRGAVPAHKTFFTNRRRAAQALWRNEGAAYLERRSSEILPPISLKTALKSTAFFASKNCPLEAVAQDWRMFLVAVSVTSKATE
jgi:hypothetical protein